MDRGKIYLVFVFVLLAISLGVPSVYPLPQNSHLRTIDEKLPPEVSLEYPIESLKEEVPVGDVEPPKVQPLESGLSNTRTARATATATDDDMDAFCRDACPSGDGGSVCNCANYPVR
ncbi:UNVERIFIED_CONTAM: hypothetical protein RMT77_014964 [Armadillidium vulgare]